MSRATFRHRLICQIAILAVLLNALMPALSQAMTTRTSVAGDWIEICSNQGSRWIRMDGDGVVVAETTQRPADAPAALHEAACAYCLTHAASFGLPPTDAGVALPPASAPPPGPVASTGHMRNRLHWERPAARAPPVHRT